MPITENLMREVCWVTGACSLSRTRDARPALARPNAAGGSADIAAAELAISRMNSRRPTFGRLMSALLVGTPAGRTPSDQTRGPRGAGQAVDTWRKAAIIAPSVEKAHESQGTSL